MTDDVNTPSRHWTYGPAQYELAVLDRLVREGRAANRTVHYEENHARCSASAEFSWAAASGPLTVRANGGVAAFADGRPVPVTVTGPVHALEVPPGTVELVLRVTGPEGAPAAVAPSRGTWRSRVEPHEPWQSVRTRCGTDEPPHTGPLADTVVLVPTDVGGVLELPTTVLGRPVLHAATDAPPTVRTGESREEALDGTVVHETRHDLVQRPDGRWTTVHQLGFRHLLVTGADDVHVEVSVHPHAAGGSFTTSDEALNRIWSTSTTTLTTCMHGLMLDGVKRDRMPWIGDQAVNTLSNAYAVGDPDIAWDSQTALGHPSHGYVNGIADYSLWWLVNSRSLARYLAPPADPLAHARHAETFARTLVPAVGDDGLLRPDRTPRPGPPVVFIDWGVDADPARDATALQVLWFWALRSLADTLTAAGSDATEWSTRAADLRDVLFARAWDADRRHFREYVDGPASHTPHADVFAVLSGIDGGDPTRRPELPADLGRLPGTPFQTSFALWALARTGHTEAVVALVRERWGAMLDAGATTFWEDFADDEPLAMYGRRYGRSLCHAWAAGPAFLLPAVVLGVEPLQDGWATFSVAPSLGALSWARAVVPTAHGQIRVEADGVSVRVDVPAGTTLVAAGRRTAGPATVVLR